MLYKRNGYHVLDNIVEVGGDVLILYRSIGYSVNDNHKHNVITPNTEVLGVIKMYWVYCKQYHCVGDVLLYYIWEYIQ